MDVMMIDIEQELNTKKVQKDIKKGFLFFRALNHPIRQRIIELIAEYGEMNVTGLQIKLRIDQAIVSQQLAILREANVVIPERRGQFIFYSCNDYAIQDALLFCAELS